MKHQIETSLFGIAALLGRLSAVQAAPVVISTTQGRGADMSVRGGAFATGNHGTNLLRVRNAANLQDARKLYVRFDLSPLTAPVKEATSASMTLQMLAAEGSSPAAKVWTFNVSGLKDGIPEENWDESKATWNDAPASDIKSPIGLTNEAAPLGAFTVTGAGTPGQKVVFSSPALLKFLQGDTNGVVTLIVTRQEQGTGEGENVTHIFVPKESSKTAAPYLTVAFKGEDLASAVAPQAAPITYSLPTEAVPDALPHASEINEFWESDKKQMPRQGAVLFIGSSSIKLWDTLAQDFPEIPVINRGFGGSLIEESTRYADRIVFPYKPKMIVMAAGTNDLAYGGKNPQAVLQEFQDFAARVHEGLPNTRLVYISINPTVARWNQESDTLEANYLIEKWIHENNSPTQKLNFINSHAAILTADGQPQLALLREDKLHFNAAGYKVWTSILKPRILALATMEGVERLDAPKAATATR